MVNHPVGGNSSVRNDLYVKELLNHLVSVSYRNVYGVSTKYQDKWTKLWDNVYLQDYTPIWNVEGTDSTVHTFEHGKVFFATLGSASEVVVQENKDGIADDAVSAVMSQAVIYIPFAELVDIEKEIQRLEKEEQRLEKELARVNGMLKNERFISKAPQSKIDEEKAKLEKYTQMMEQVKERLAQLK